MTIESAADRALFLDTDEFAATATIGANSFPGIFDNEYVEIEDVAATRPVFHCDAAVAAVAGAAIDVSIVIAGITYKIRILRPDGTGMTLLVLEQQ